MCHLAHIRGRQIHPTENNFRDHFLSFHKADVKRSYWFIRLWVLLEICPTWPRRASWQGRRYPRQIRVCLQDRRYTSNRASVVATRSSFCSCTAQKPLGIPPSLFTFKPGNISLNLPLTHSKIGGFYHAPYFTQLVSVTALGHYSSWFATHFRQGSSWLLIY